MKKTAEDADEKIRENTVKAEKLYIEKAKSMIDEAKAGFNEKEEEYKAEADLLRGRLRAYGVMDGEGEKITDRDAFIKLEREHKALDDYYRAQWAKAKRRIRKEEFKNRNGEDKDKK